MQHTLPLPSLRPSSRQAGRPVVAVLSLPWLAPALFALGLILRGLLLNRPGLHPDEALYASWALRIADGSDPALLGVYVDKPPLLLYLLAGLFRLAGFDGATPPDFQRLILAGRLAALLASGASLALLWLVARRVQGPRVALAALALFALSPLAVRLSSTLFTDPWLTLWLLLGLWAALDRRAWLAGIACGLAYATKQQAVLFIPLVLATFWLCLRRPVAPNVARPYHGGNELSAAEETRPGKNRSLRRRPGAGNPSTLRLVWRWLNGFALIAVAVLWWDSLRWQWMPSYWDRSAETYGGLALAVGASLPQRLAQWGELLGYTFGWPLLLALTLFSLWAILRPNRATTAAAGAVLGFERLLLAFITGYMLLHVATNLAPWDRYLLPLIPLLALLLARGLELVWRWIAGAGAPTGRRGWSRMAVALVLATSLTHAGYTASFARLPLGDGGAYDGVRQVAAHLRSAEPPGAILYHHWLGWHYGFYLYGTPLELRWWQEPLDLARKAAASPDRRQLIAFPGGRDEADTRAALTAAGLALSPVMVANDGRGAPSVTLYSLVRTPAGALTHAP